MFKIKSEVQLLTFGLLAAFATSANAEPNLKKLDFAKSSKSADYQHQLAKQEAKFFENNGQWDRRGQFLARQPDLDVWYENRGVDFDYYHVSGVQGKSKRVGQRVSMQFAGHTEPLKFKGVKDANAVRDYILGNTTVHRSHGYSEVAANSVFPGVDFRGYFEENHPRYDFIVSPKANPSEIKLKFAGADNLSLSPKGIVLKTSVGERVQGDLHAYQVINGSRKAVSAKFELLAKNEVGVKVGAYDQSKPLVIDPLIYGTYFGGDGGFDEVRSVVSNVGIGNSTFLAGYTQSTVFPAIYGPYGFNKIGPQNAFIASLQGDAFGIDYAAYIGGSGTDVAQFLKLDPQGTLWMVGTTNSTNFPGNTFANNGSNYCFALPFFASSTTVLNPLPTKEFSFGAATTILNGFDINQGSTSSTDMVFSGTTTAPISAMSSVTFPGANGIQEGFMLRMNFTQAGGYSVNLPFCKYIAATAIAGVAPQFAVVNRGVAIDTSGNTFVCGTVFGNANYDTSQPGTAVFPTTSGVYAGGQLLKQSDIFVQEYSGSTGALVWSSLVGGHSNDYAGGFALDLNGTQQVTGSAIAIDGLDNVYVTGVSNSYDFPRTRGVYGEVFTDLQNVTVTKISGDGTSIIYSTNLNSTFNMIPAGIQVDASGDAFITGNGTPGELFPDDIPGGTAGDPDQPMTNTYPTIGTTTDGLAQPAFPTAPDFGAYSAWFNVLKTDASGLLYGSYLGGTLDTRVDAPYVDAFGDCWVFGWVETYRAYTVVSSTNTPTNYKDYASLPGSMLSQDAFKPYPDNGTPTNISENYGLLSPYYGFTRTQYNIAAPRTVGMSVLRDGWVNKIRVGLPSVQSVTMSPGTIPGGFGAFSTGTVTLSLPAPSGGSTIQLSITNGSGGFFDANNTLTATTITIPAGSTTGTFQVFSAEVSSTQTLTVNADYLGSFENTSLSIVPYLNRISITPTSIVGGNQLSGLIQLYANAPSSGVQVLLSTTTPSLISFTDPTTGNAVSTLTVTVPSGSSALTVPINTGGVIKNTAASVSASIGGFTLTQSVTLTPASLSAFNFNPNPVPGGDVSVGTVTLNGLAGQALTINLAPASGTSLPAGFVYPATFTVPAGASTGTFNITTPHVAVATNIALQATIVPVTGGTFSTASVVGTLSVTPFSIQKLTVSPATIAYDQTGVGTVTLLQNAPASGVTVTLSSSDPASVSVPSSVTIPSGANSATFTVQAGFPDVTKTVTISASLGSDVLTTTVTVTPVAFSLALNPSEVTGGTSTTAALTIDSPAPAGGLTLSVVVSPNNVGVSAPSTVTIPQNATEVDFPVTTTAVTKSVTATITATYSLSSKTSESVSAQLIVDPVGVSTITFNPNPVHGSHTTQCTITLNGAATSNGTIVLSQSNPYLVLPASVPVAQGQSSITFPVVVKSVSRQVSTTVKATYNGTVSTIITILR